MRPHRLRVTAFGPFPGTVELDLDEVSGAGPFLLRGATGAGKTSLLDAVGYALFGRVPGARGLKQLRSDHAADGVRTSVELWATVGGRAVHVVRTPDQRRPKARGTGTTADKATVSVRVATDLSALEADDCTARWWGVQEANDELARLVGMTHEQFVQVVLLPQGDFARFLRARDEERADVLRALFDTRRFRAVEQHLRELRDAARDALGDAASRVGSTASRVAALAGQDEPPVSDAAGWAEALLRESDGAASVAGQRAAEASERVSSVRTAHQGARTLARLLDDLVARATAQTTLLERSAAVGALAAELGDAERASAVVTAHELHEQARLRVSSALDTARTTVAASEDARLVALGTPDVVDLDAADLDASDLDASDLAVMDLDVGDLDGVVGLVDAGARAAVDAHARLEALGREVRRWEEQQTDLTLRREALLAAETALAEVRAGVAALPGRVAELTDLLEDERAAAADAGPAEHEVQRWAGLVAAAARLQGLVADVAHAEAADLAARARARADEERHDGLRRARLAGMSAELARGLVLGEPCTVCGATEHPAPAVADGETVDAEAEEAARTAAVRTAAAAARAGAGLAEAAAHRDAGHARLLAEASPDVAVPELPLLDRASLDDLQAGLTDRVSAARSRLVSARAAATLAATTLAELDRARAEQAAAGDVLGRAVADVAGLAAAVQAVEAEARGVRAHLCEVLGDRVAAERPSQVLAERLAEATTRVARARDAVDAVGAVVGACAEARRAREAAATAASEAGWPDVRTAVACARPRAWREGTRRDVDRHERELHGVRLAVQTRRQELAETGVTLPPDDGAVLVEAALGCATAAGECEARLADELAAAEAVCREADGEHARLRAVLDGLLREVPQLVSADRATAPLRDEADATRALADLCGGVNDKGVPLSTYVLAAHLEHVVEAANLRLDGMSDGRYALVHVEEGEDRRRRAGLGLAVVDAWTGRQRPAGTLSGGETFLASLALALGLADVVTAEAGGARIDALFVDEGFGTLDPDSLDRAMDVLDQLQEHGRMVGVVSHVGELRQRLPRQVHVEAGRRGSTVHVMTG